MSKRKRFRMNRLPMMVPVCALLVGSYLALLGLKAIAPAAYVAMELKKFDSLWVLFVGLAGGGYALLRNSTYPANHAKYLAWLTTTPWRRGMPLPFRQFPFDLADIVSLFALLATVAIVSPGGFQLKAGGLIVLMSGAYAFGATMSLFTGGQRVIGFVVLVGVGLAMRLVISDFAAWKQGGPALHGVIAAMALLPVLATIAAFGIWRGLAAYPWDESLEKQNDVPTREAGERNRLFVATVGGAQKWVMPGSEGEPAQRVRSVVKACVLGWYVYVVASLFHIDGGAPTDKLLFAFAIPTGMFALGRMMRYLNGMAGMLGPWARLRTGQLVIPRWDIVLAGPATILAVGCAGAWMAFKGLPSAWPAVLGVTVAGIIIASRTVGPSVQAWRLTGAWTASGTGTLGKGQRSASI